MDTSHLTVANLKKQLALEEATSVADATTDTGGIPIMKCLRSPTTRTFNAILDNMNHFDAIKDFLAEAEQEEKETQELIDAAEELQAMPLAAAFVDATREGLEHCDSIQFTLPRNAAGDVLNVRMEDSPILKKRPGSAMVVEPAFMMPPPKPLKPLAFGEDVSENGASNSRTVAYTDGRTVLKKLLGEQQELMTACNGESRDKYETMMRTYGHWQEQRMALFDNLLEVDRSQHTPSTTALQPPPQQRPHNIDNDDVDSLAGDDEKVAANADDTQATENSCDQVDAPSSE